MIIKSVLLISIIVLIVATSTTQWDKFKATIGGTSFSVNAGLFKTCVKDKCTDNTDTNSVGKSLKSCQGLAISAIVFLSISLVLFSIPSLELKHSQPIAMGSMLLGIILTIACVSLYADEIHKPIHKLQNHINDIMMSLMSWESSSNFSCSFLESW